MLRKRIVALALVTAVALGASVVGAAGALAQSTDSTTPTTEASTPIGGSFSVDIPGVGSLTFNLDPATGAITDLVVTPADGVSAGEPTVTAEGVRIVLTAADGTVRILEVEVSLDDNGLEIEIEIELDADDAEDDADDNHSPGSGEDEADEPDAGNGSDSDEDSGSDDDSGSDSDSDSDDDSDDDSGSDAGVED